MLYLGIEDASASLSRLMIHGMKRQAFTPNSQAVPIQGPSQPSTPLSAAGAGIRTKQKHKIAVLPSRQLPLRDSRVAACLQNQIIAECERSGWRSMNKSVATTGRKEGEGQDENVANRGNAVRKHKVKSVSAELPALSKDQSSSHKKGGGDSVKISSRKNVSRAQTGIMPPVKHNISSLRSAKEHLPLLPPPAVSGRPRRRAAERALAGIAAATDEKGRFLVLEWPSFGEFRPIKQKPRATRRQGRKMKGTKQRSGSLRATKRAADVAVVGISGDASEGLDVHRKGRKRRRGVTSTNSEFVVEIDDLP